MNRQTKVPYKVKRIFKIVILTEKYKNSGAGGIRTRVQTSNLCAFYMLSLFLIFDYDPGTNTLTVT